MPDKVIHNNYEVNASSIKNMSYNNNSVQLQNNTLHIKFSQLDQARPINVNITSVVTIRRLVDIQKSNTKNGHVKFLHVLVKFEIL